MPDFEYGNARLRAMKSRLLSRGQLEALTEAGSLQALIAGLTKTAYQRSIESALTRFAGMECVNEAMRIDLTGTIGKIHGFYHEEAHKRIVLVLRSYDIENLKAVLRGLSKNASSVEILAALLPVGELKIGTLRELARLDSPRESIDLLASQSLPFANPLLDLRATHPGAEVFEMELALDRWRFREARQALRSEAEASPLSSAIDLDADLANLLTALRFAHDPRERDLRHNGSGHDGMAELFIEAGRIPIERLVQAGRQDGLASAVESLAGTPYETALRQGLEAYRRTNRLSEVEKRLKRQRLARLSLMIEKDPLGIGVVLGYIALKVSEVGNLHWIAHGLNQGLKAEEIQAELETIS